MDPRIYQIAALAGLLIYGLWRLEFDIPPTYLTVLLGGVLAAQFAFDRWWARQRFEPRSALISGLSLCLLLRTNSLWLAAAAAVLAIGGKFLLRWNGKHLFNPTNFALVVLLAASDGSVWVSPGQWGNVAFFGFLTVCMGGLVIHRAGRWDITIAFLAFYIFLVVGRAVYLGDPLAIPLHRLQSGALLIFAFFMISDPRTTPDSRAGRILFAAIVALLGWGIQTWTFRAEGILWGLAFASPLVPLIDRFLPFRRFQWSDTSTLATARS